VDNEGQRQVVKYNMDMSYPMLNGGWSEIREFYGLSGDHVVYFDYVGNKIFKFTLFKGESTDLSVDKFYDRLQNCGSLIEGFYDHFIIVLSHYQCDSSFLVTFFA